MPPKDNFVLNAYIFVYIIKVKQRGKFIYKLLKKSKGMQKNILQVPTNTKPLQPILGKTSEKVFTIHNMFVFAKHFNEDICANTF